MADRRRRDYSNSMMPPPRGQARPQPRIPRPRSSYPDSWESQEDEQHRNRVELFRMRRDSVSLSGRSRPTTPSTPRSMSTIKSPTVEVRQKWKSNTPWARDRRTSSSICSEVDTSDACMSPVALRNELDRYDRESKLLTQQEWVAPPTPRGRVRRMNAKEFNIEKIKAVKRWNKAQGVMYGMNSSFLRDTDTRQPPEAYDPGVIFSAPFHTPAGSEDMHIPDDDPSLTATPFGTINSKFRKMIVLRVFGEHVQCLPIYSHNGRGLEGKDFPREYVSIRDVNDPFPHEDEGPHRGLRASKDGQYTGTFIIDCLI
ncbi:hypothetical protein F5Y05DRAFT_410228 [Hypoxylon sp. FL0543]|nr:hypothetical protein F5Y05DRAFT_410228 [Hypoxylon sp. FL0543]